jgi:hypothetical protein
MDISPYVERVREDLAATAAAGGADPGLTERLTRALDPALRLSILDALSQAAAEITTELPAGTVDVRLRGRDPEFVVDVPAPAPPPPIEPGPSPAGEGDETVEGDERVTRITLRIPESLKSKAEELAARSGYSLNTWIVFAIRLATRESGSGVRIDVDLGGLVGDEIRKSFRRSGRRMKGWV